MFVSQDPRPSRRHGTEDNIIHICSQCEEVEPQLTDAMGPIKSCLALPAFAKAPYDALIMAAGTPVSATLTRAVFGMALVTTSYIPTETPIAADVLPTHPQPQPRGAGCVPVLCVTVATGGPHGRSELFCADEGSDTGERRLRAMSRVEAPGFNVDARTLCAVCCAPGRLLQVTALEIRLVDLTGQDPRCQTWAPPACSSAAAGDTITSALIAPSHPVHGTPTHAVVLTAGEIISVRVSGGGTGMTSSATGPMHVAASRPLPHSVTGGAAFRMHDGTEVAVTGFWVESLAFAVLRADTLDTLAEHVVMPGADSAGAAATFASVVGKRVTRVLVGGLAGQVTVYRLQAGAAGSTYSVHLECTVRVGRTHVRFAQLWDDREGVATGGPNATARRKRTCGAGVLAVAGRSGLLLWPEAAAAADDAADAAAASARGGAGLLTSVVSLPSGSHVASVCSVGGSGVVWAEAAGGVAMGDLDRREQLQRHSQPLPGAPQSVVHCAAVHAVACHVRSSHIHSPRSCSRGDVVCCLPGASADDLHTTIRVHGQGVARRSLCPCDL